MRNRHKQRTVSNIKPWKYKSRFGVSLNKNSICGTIKLMKYHLIIDQAFAEYVRMYAGKALAEIEKAKRDFDRLKPLRLIWENMRQRCCNPKNKSYENYGGRGIKICAYWLESFAHFAVDIGNRPSMRHTLERIQNDQGYWCGHCDECIRLGRKRNCRWATYTEQMRNRRITTFITHNGRCQSLAAWSEETGIHRHTLQYRLKAKWPTEDIMKNPKGMYHPYKHCHWITLGKDRKTR